MATRKEIAQNQKILYDDAVANNMFQAAVPSFKEFQKRLEGQGYQKMVYDNYKKHNVRGKGFNNLNEFRGAFGGSFYADENKIGVSNRAAAISASAQQTMNNAGRYNRLKQRKQKQQKDFGRVNLGTHQTPYGGDANNVVKDDFAYNPETGKAGAYVTSDNENVYSQNDAEQKQNLLDKYGEEWNNAVDMGIVPSELDKSDPDLSDTDVAMRQMERRQEWLNENQDRRSKELNESMHLQGSPFVASGGAVAPSSFNTAISNEANRLSDVEYGAYNTAKAYNQMLRTTLLQELKEQKQRNENAGWWKDKWNDVSNYFGAMFNTMLDPKLYSQGVMDAAISNNLLQVKKGMEDGTIKKGSNAGNAAQAMLGAIQQQQGEAAKQQQYGSKAYLYGDISGRSLKFMADFALSGWRNVMTTGFTKAGEKVGEKMALGALGKWFTKNTGRVLGDIAGSAALAATNQLGSTYNNVIERYVGMNNENGGVTQDKNGDLKFNEGVSLGKAIKDGFGSATIENFSEMFGEYLPGAPKLLSKLGLSKVSSFFEKIGNNAYYKWLSNATNKSGIQGVMAEISEEEFGTALHAAWGDGDGSWSDFNVFTNPDAREKQIDTCLGMFYSVGFMHSPRTAVGAINAVQYFNIKHQVAKADKFGQMMFNDKWDEIKSKIDVTTNADLTKTVLDATRSDSMTAKQKGAVINYAMFLSKLRGFNQAADAKTKDKVEEGDTAPTLSNDLDDAYTEGHNADGTDKHNIQLEQNDKANELAAMLHITPEQLHDMADEDLEAMTGKDDKLDQAIYDYQVSTAKYQGVMDGAQDEVDMAAHQAAMETDNMTDLSRGTVRKATIKATGGLEDYEVYIISGNIATHDDGSIDVGNSDDMIIYYDPTTGRKEHADAMMFADLIEELPAADVKAQAINDAKENAIKKIAGVIDGTVEVGSQFSVTDADGTEHTYEVLADNGDGTAMITIDGNVPTELVKGENVQIPYSFADLQQMKDMEDQKRLEAAKTEREQMEKERAEQQNQETEQTQPSFDFNQILNDNGNVVLADVLGKDGNTKYPNSQLFLIRDSGAKAKVVELKSDGTLVPHAVNKKDVRTATTMTLDEYKQAFAESSMIEENSGAIEVEDNEEGKLLNRNDDGAQTEQNQPSASVTTSQEDAAGSSESKDTNISANGNKNNENLTFEDGTPIPVDVNGEVDLSQTDASHAAEWYDNNLGEDADDWLDGEIKKAKKVLEQAKNKKLTGSKPSELVASKKEKEAAIADAQAHYDSAISIRDSLKERRIAKEENTSEGRKELIEKARRKFARLKSAVKDDAEAVSQLYRDTIGSLLHRLYDGTGIDVTDTIPLTAEEYVASNLGAHSLNYEGTETSKGVKQETGLTREDFAKTQLLAADGKGTTIDALVHSLWENRPSNLESLDTQEIRNALISVLNSGFKASEARNFVENIRIAQAENILEEQKRALENAAYAEQHKAEQEAELGAKSDEKAELKAKSEAKLDNESDNKSNDLSNETDNEKINDNINDNINVPEDATDENPLGVERDESDLPFSAKENGKQQTTAERAADVEKNKVDDMKVVDNIVGQKTRKTLEKLAKMMGANVQWQYSDKNANGWFDDKTNTIYLTLDSSITEGVQFIFGHEMTHEMRTKNPAAYDELKTLVKDMMGEDAFNSETDRITSLYNENNVFYNGGRTAYEEEVVADQLGKWIRDANYAHTLLLKMSHPLLAKLHEIVNRFLMALHGIEISDDMNLILRSIEQAYVKTANGEVTNSETGEDVSFSLRQKPEPKKKGIGYKVFVLKDGKLYPPMVANPDGAATPVGVWLDADAAPIAGESKTGRPQVKQGGKGTQGGSGKLAYRPGWHLGVVPYAIQFNRKDADGNKTLFPKNFVFAEVEYAADVDYQEEARQEGINPSGKYQHSLAGLKHLPTDGYYMYRTNPNPETDPWVITGAMKVNRILTRAEQAELVKNAGREPQQIQEGDIVTDDVVNSINQEIADAPKFSLKVYHGSGADFTEFDFDHMGEGAGSQVFGWGGYVTSSKKIGKDYASIKYDPDKDVEYVGKNKKTFTDLIATLFDGGIRDYNYVKNILLEISDNDKSNISKKEEYDWFVSTKPEDWFNPNPTTNRNLYEVNIPEDNGSNYLEWEKTLTEKQINAIRDALAKNGVDISSFEKRGFKLDLPFKYVYTTVLPTMMHYNPKDVSKFLSSLGFTGIKYPAGTIMGGAEEGDTNYVIFKPEDMKITEHTKFSLKSKPVRFEAGKKLSDEEKKEVLSTLKDAYKVNGVPYHIEETAGGKEKRVYEPTADSYVVSDITNRPLRYYITLPDGRVAHPTEVYPNISDNEVKSSATKQGLLDEEVDQIVSAAIGNMKDIADNAKAIEVLTELQNLPHETHDVGYGMNNAQSYNYKTGIFTSDAAQAIDYVVRRMRRKEDVPTEIPAALKKAVADSYGMVDNLIDGMSNTKGVAAEIKPVGVGAFGNIYNQFRGKAKAAIEFLKKLGSGEATAALHHHTIGDISLVWGDKKTGLDKILRKHPEVVDNLQSIIDSMEVVQESDNRIKLESPTHFAVVSKEYKGEPREQWLLTAYEKRESLENGKSMDTATSSLGGDTALSQSKESAAKIDNSSETAKENGEKFSLKDEEYLKAVEDGDMEKAQKMVNEAAEAAGYSTDSSYQGTSAFNGSAPWGNGYFLTKEERKEAWDNDEYDGDQTLGDYIHRGIDAMNLDFIALDPRNYRAADPMRKEAIDNVRNAIQKKSETITMYRSVPSDVKEGSFRNGDWVTPSSAYAVDNAKIHGWGDNFNIIEQKVPVDEIWWDGNDIAEWGYGREEDYVNDTDFAYKNTKNNRKLLDAVTYDDNGNVIPLSQRFNENNADVRYSLKYEKTMFGMHNISLDKLRKAIKQGGFAAPSMGVIDSKNGIYSGYGEITLIPKAEKIAKRTGKNIGTYAADAWTPIYPPVEKKFGGNGGDVAYDDIESVPKEMQSLTRNAINSFMDGRDTNSLAYLYLHEKGKAPELVHVEGKYPKELHDEVKGILGKLNGIYNTTDEQKEKLLDLFIREVYDGNKEEFDNDIKKFIKKDEEFIKKRPNSNISKDKQLDVDWMKEHGYDYGALSRFVDGILRDAETSGKVDENATMKAAQQYIQDKDMKEDFDSWKEKLNDRYQVEEVIFAGYKDDGNRKYLPNTVENAVKVMKQDGKNASVGSASFSHFVASILKPMGTLDQIRKKKGNLTGNYEDVEKFQEKWQPVYDELADKMQPDAEPFESYGMDRLEDAATQKNPKKYAKDQYGVDLTDEDIDKLNELIDAVKNEKPSIYFETKFMRPYGLDEFEKAIVPNDTPSDVVDALKMAGIDVSSYERGNAEDRQKVTMDAINSSDNIRFSLKSMMEKPEGWKQANKKTIHIAEAIERDPKFSLKNLDGTLIKAGTYFSGGGLVEEGLKGIIDPVVAVEYDEKISGVYRNNFGQHIVTADVRDVDPKELVKQIDGEVEYFHASPVCKNYSQAKSNHAEVELDKETAASTAEFINAVKPKVVTIENVKGYKDSDAMKIITDALDANGYTWDADVYNAADYGGYTNRERLIVRAVRDGKLPEKPKKMARKSGWYEAVADIIPTLTEKKNGVAPWMDIRLKADGIDWRNIDKPLYVMGSAYADGKIPHAFADELLPTLRTKSGDVIVMPDGKVYRAMGRVLARVSGVSDDYKMPFSENLSHTIIGNGIPTQLTEHVIAPLLTGSDPKFSIRTYHGTGAKFDKFDLSHALEGEGSETFGHGVYVTNSKEIGTDYAQRAKDKKAIFGFEFVNPQSMSKEAQDMLRHYMYKHQDVAKGLENARKDLKDVIGKFPDTDYLQELNEILAKDDDSIAIPSNRAYRYDVDIPDDNGSNYLGWNESQNFPLEKWYRLWEITHEGFNENEYFKDGGARYDIDRIERITQMKLESPENGMQKLPTLKGEELYHALEDFFDRERPSYGAELASRALSEIGFVGIKYPAGMIHGGAVEGDYNYVIFDENNANIVGNTRFSLRYDQFEHDLNQWKKDNNLPKDAQRPTIPQRNAGESAVDFLRRVDEYRKQMALWKTAPTYEQHLLSDNTALGEFNRELQRGSVLKRIAFQDSMLAIRKAQEAIMKEVGVDRLNMAEDAYTAENRSHGKGKNEFEEYNNEFLQPLRKAYHQMKKILGDSYDNVRIYMMAKHGLERDAQMAFKKSLEADYEDVAQRSAAYKAYKGDMNRIINDSDLEFGRVDFTTWRQRDNALRVKYSPSYMDYRYDKNGIAYDYSGLSALFDGSDFEEAAYKLVKDIEDKYVTEIHNLWDATNAATKKILRDGYKAGMMSKDTYQYVRDMYSHYIPLRGWDGTTADQVWDYIGVGKGAFNQTLKKAHGRTSIADDPIAYIENMAESGILLNNKNWVKQHLMLLAQNHPTSLLTLSKAWYVKSVDDNGNEEWIPATPQITYQMNSNQVKAAIDAFEKKMEQMAQTGDATQKRDGLNIAYPQTHSEEREHEVRVMKDGEEYVIYVNGDPQLAQAMNNTRAHRVREIQSGKLDRAAAWLGRKMAAAYTSLSPLFIPSNYFRDLTMTLASTAIREDAKYNYLLRKNLATSWNLGFMLKDYQNGKLREKVSNGNATPKEQMFYDFMMNGGETGFVSSLDVEDLKKKFKNDLKDLDRWKANPVKVGHTIMDSIEFLNRMIEDSNRFSVYMTSIQYGRSIDEAVNDAKNVTLNFNRKGTGEYGWQMIRNLYLFINPAVQSLQTLGALAKHHPFKFTAVTASWLASGVLVPVVNAALMSLLGGDDDKDKYWQFSKWDRRNNLIMWIPYTHEYVKIPLAQEFRAFYGVGDMIASKMMGGELAEESWEEYAEDLMGQVVDMLPLDPTGYDGNIAVSLMPNAIRPVFELAFNVDFTGKPLFKDTEYNKYDPNFTKAYVGTPDWLVRASKMVNSIGNDYPDVQQNGIDAFGDPRYNLNNPAVVDHVLSSYLGGAYTVGSQVLGLLTKSLNDPKEIKVADIPLFSKFVSNPDDRPVTKKQGDEFWNMKENHDRAANTLSKLKKQAKVNGDYSMLERFYGSEEYKQYKQDDAKVKKYEEDKKKERAEESGEEYRPHKLNAEDIYKAHATPKDDFEDLKLKQLYTKLNGFKSAYDLLVDTAPSQSDGYYNTNKTAIDAIDKISLDKQEISELKKGFLDDGKDAYNAEDMKQIRELRKKILAVLEKANKVVVANQKAKAKK